MKRLNMATVVMMLEPHRHLDPNLLVHYLAVGIMKVEIPKHPESGMTMLKFHWNKQ